MKAEQLREPLLFPAGNEFFQCASDSNFPGAFTAEPEGVFKQFRVEREVGCHDLPSLCGSRASAIDHSDQGPPGSRARAHYNRQLPAMPEGTIMKKTTTLAGVALTAGLAACASQQTTGDADAPMIGMANPASEYCVQLGGRLEIRKDADGSEYGMCHLPDGSVIEEWTLFRRDHSPDSKP